MKILIISQYFYPENFRINELCNELARNGNDITVLTGFPNYPDGYIYTKYKNKKINFEIINDIKVHRVNIMQRRKNVLSLILNYISFAFFASRKVSKLDRDFDFVFVYEVSPILQVMPAIKYKKMNNKPVVINCQDIWPAVINVYGIKEHSLFYKAIKQLSAYLYNKADLILNSSPGFSQYLNSVCGIEYDKMDYLPNFAESVYLNMKDTSYEQNKLHLLFAGNIGKAQGLDTLVEAVTKLSKVHKGLIIIDILGDGSYLQELKDHVHKQEMDEYFIFHGRKKIDEIMTYYEKAAAFLLTLKSNTSICLTIPSKLQGYMGAGKPILGAIDGGANEMIHISKCGKCVKSGDSEGFSEIIEEFINDETHFKSMGLEGRRYFKEHFSIEIYSSRLCEKIKEIL